MSSLNIVKIRKFGQFESVKCDGTLERQDSGDLKAQKKQ
jgi:hypothetical protein